MPLYPGVLAAGLRSGQYGIQRDQASGKTFTINCTGNPDQNGFISIQSFLPLPMTRWSVRTMTHYYHRSDGSPAVHYSVQPGRRNGDNAWFDFISNISEAGQSTSTSMTTKQGPSLRTGRTLESSVHSRRLQQRLIVVSSPEIHPDS